MDPQQRPARYDERPTETATRAEEAGARLRQVDGTATSPRGEVEVRVGASGVLEDLTLTAAARTLESDELARLIVDTVRRARHAAGARAAGIPAGYFADPPEITR